MQCEENGKCLKCVHGWQQMDSGQMESRVKFERLVILIIKIYKSVNQSSTILMQNKF